MHDVFGADKRSEVMSKIRSSGNKSTEVAFVNLMRLAGITGWRRHLKVSILQISGQKGFANKHFTVKPDFIFRQVRLAVFVDGCFWHQCAKHSTLPRNNSEFWAKKLRGNVERDRRTNKFMRLAGWCVLRIWEHDMNDHIGIIRRIKRCITIAKSRMKPTSPTKS